MKRLLLLGLFAGALGAMALTEDDFLKPVGRPPRAATQRRQGGQAVPPLPLPATPLRRSEKKRPPTPPTLVGKVIWGAYKDYQWEDGQVSRVYDWNMVPADVQSLLQTAERHLNMKYAHETVALDTFNATPAEIPVLYFCGGRRLRCTDQDRETLRKYMLAGGMVWFDSNVGSPFFYTSALEELAKVFPEQPIERLPLDHPVFHMIDSTVTTTTNMREETPPVLDGLYIGSRLAAVVSPYGLGCGWDKTSPDLIAKANYYDPKSATLLGLNLVSYAVGYFRVAQAYARGDAYRGEDAAGNRDPLIFTRLRVPGAWNTAPGAPANLLRFINKNLTVKTSYRTQTLELGKDALDGLPFVYLSGAAAIDLDEADASALRRYLLDGGYLLIDNALGMQSFDASIRAELRKVLPDGKLEPIPAAHAIYTSGPFTIDRVRYSIAVRATRPELVSPQLEGIAIDGDYRVVYSRYDLAAGWQGDEHPLAKHYLPGDALQLGANLMTYFLTH